MNTLNPKAETVSIFQARQLTGLTRDQVLKLCGLGKLRMVEVPMSTPRIMRADVLKFIESSRSA